MYRNVTIYINISNIYPISIQSQTLQMGANCSFLPSLSQNAIATIATRSWFWSLDQNLSLSPVQPFLFDVSAENIALQLTENMTLLETQGRTSKVWPATTTKTKSAKCRRKSSISQLTAGSSHLVMVNYSILLVYDPVLTGPHTFHTRSKKFNALNVVLPWHRFREAELLAARLGSSFHSSTQTRNGQQMPR